MRPFWRQAFGQCADLCAITDPAVLRLRLCEILADLLGARACLLLGYDDTARTCLALHSWPVENGRNAFPLATLEREGHPLLRVLSGHQALVLDDPRAPGHADLMALFPDYPQTGPESTLVILPGALDSRPLARLGFLLRCPPGPVPASGCLEAGTALASVGAALCHTAIRLARLREDNALLSRSLETAEQDRSRMRAAVPRALSGNLVGSCEGMDVLRTAIARYAPGELPVLIQGESGTGKELVARELHRLSGRRAGPFVAINMAALPDTLAEAELFGHVKGAFTGAVGRRDGHVLSANGGTLFLDEVGDMSAAMQARLLRVLQEKVFRPVGSDREVASDFRLICATHRDLRALTREGTFREDLFFRLAGVRIHLPPLRERGADILELAEHFLRGHARRAGCPEVGLSGEVRERLLTLEFPGNVRELEALCGRLWLEAGDATVIGAHHLEPCLSLSGPAPAADLPSLAPGGAVGLKEACEMFERSLLTRRLDGYSGNRSLAARSLGISRSTFFEKLKKHGLEGDQNATSR